MDDFDDSIADLIGGTQKPRPTQERLPDVRSREQKLAAHMQHTAEAGSFFVHQCEKCAGSGYWKGNRRFPCFACKGKGTRSFKTSPETRAKARAKSTEKAAQREIDRAAWREANADAIAWTRRQASRNAERGGTFTWPASILEKLEEYGTWTDGILLKVRELMERDRMRFAERDAQRPTATVDASKIEIAFAHARERAARPGMEGMWTRPLKLRVGETDLLFTPGSVGSQWEGMVFVKAGEKKLGAIKAGQFKGRFECSAAELAAVKDACEDPHKAANAFCKAWRRCGVCGRTLTNDESIEQGIGPICAGKYGW